MKAPVHIRSNMVYELVEMQSLPPGSENGTWWHRHWTLDPGAPASPGFLGITLCKAWSKQCSPQLVGVSHWKGSRLLEISSARFEKGSQVLIGSFRLL